MNPLAPWLADRTPRERLLFAAMLALAVLWLGFAAVWQPLQLRRATLTDQIARHDRAVAVLQAAPVVVQTPQDDRPLNVIITETAAGFQLVIRRLEPDGQRLALVLEEAPFDAVILWLETLHREHGLAVTTLDLTRRPAPGTVNASLTLERPAP